MIAIVHWEGVSQRWVKAVKRAIAWVFQKALFHHRGRGKPGLSGFEKETLLLKMQIGPGKLISSYHIGNHCTIAVICNWVFLWGQANPAVNHHHNMVSAQHPNEVWIDTAMKRHFTYAQEHSCFMIMSGRVLSGKKRFSPDFVDELSFQRMGGKSSGLTTPNCHLLLFKAFRRFTCAEHFFVTYWEYADDIFPLLELKHSCSSYASSSMNVFLRPHCFMRISVFSGTVSNWWPFLVGDWSRLWERINTASSSAWTEM